MVTLATFFFFLTCITSTQLKTITAHYCALDMAKYAVIEFLLNGKLVCVFGVMVIAFVWI